jgi:hypothetical protein
MLELSLCLLRPLLSFSCPLLFIQSYKVLSFILFPNSVWLCQWHIFCLHCFIHGIYHVFLLALACHLIFTCEIRTLSLFRRAAIHRFHCIVLACCMLMECFGHRVVRSALMMMVLNVSPVDIQWQEHLVLKCSRTVLFGYNDCSLFASLYFSCSVLPFSCTDFSLDLIVISVAYAGSED